MLCVVFWCVVYCSYVRSVVHKNNFISGSMYSYYIKNMGGSFYLTSQKHKRKKNTSLDENLCKTVCTGICICCAHTLVKRPQKLISLITSTQYQFMKKYTRVCHFLFLGNLNGFFQKCLVC